MGCAGDQCCFSEQDEISICEHILGDDFVNEETTNQAVCLIRQFTHDGECVGVGHGCLYTFDSTGSVNLSADFISGSGYLRPRLNGSQFRDAKNRISDLRVWRGDKEFVGTFVERWELQSASCVDNRQDFACWGTEQGHPCVCFHDPPVNCLPGMPTSPDSGIIKQLALYIHDGWPFNPGFVTGNRGVFHAHRWDGNPSVDVSLVDAKRGQTKFVSSSRDWKNTGKNFATNALIQCQAFVPDGSPCGECSGIRHCDLQGCERNQDHYFGDTSHPFTNLFKQLVFQNWNPTLQGDSDEVDLYNEILDSIQVHEFPVSGGFPGQVTLFDRLDDNVGGPGQNLGMGVYSRGWTATVTEDTPQGPIEVPDISAGVKVKDLEGVKTKWGGCPVEAELVIVDVQVWAHAHLHKTSNKVTLSRIRVWPFFVFSVTVKLGVRATIVPDCEAPNTGCPGEDVPCMIGDEEVMVYYPPGSMFPMVTPLGNEIDYGHRIRPVVEWRGKSSHLSVPPVEGRQYVDARPPGEGGTGGFGCDFIREALDSATIDIPPLPGDVEGDDPNNWFGGSIRLRFHKP